MFNVFTELAKNAGGCLFCQRGDLRKDGKGLKYPYHKVWIIRANGFVIRICGECLKELKKVK